MSVPIAYIGVILIWSTTPLAVKWSGQDVGYLFGAFARMSISVVLGLILVRLLKFGLPWHKNAIKVYLSSCIGIYAAMICVYWGAQYVPSGWISVLFGISPLLIGFMMSALSPEKSMKLNQIIGILISLLGLVSIFIMGSHQQDINFEGIIAILFGVLFYSLSSIAVKRCNSTLPSLTITTGGLCFAVPLYLITWLATDTSLPTRIPFQVAASIVYLGIFGSIIGFALYYYVLKNLDATRTNLITLITPVTSLLMGNLLNNEIITPQIMSGTLLILSGLMVFEFGGKLKQKWQCAYR